jgi:hypothetical protein
MTWKPPEFDRTGREVVPLRKRKFDIALLGFFMFNFIFVSNMIDLECILIKDTSNFEYPIWPPEPFVRLIHWYGRNYDPLLMARPPFWMVTMFFDVYVFGPFYALAIYAFIRGRDWIRLPAIVWATMMFTIVCIILNEEAFGTYRTDHLPQVIGANLSWLIFPILVVWRVGGSAHPFTVLVGAAETAPTTDEQPLVSDQS